MCIKLAGCSSIEVAQWTSDDWVAGSNPLGGMIHRSIHLMVPCACLAQCSLNNVNKGGLTQQLFHFYGFPDHVMSKHI